MVCMINKSRIMILREVELARVIGRKVGLGEIRIPCPNCCDDPLGVQFLSSMGDSEEILFCPHCKFEILFIASQA